MIVEGSGQPADNGGPLAIVADTETDSGSRGSGGLGRGGKRAVRTAIVNKNAATFGAMAIPFLPGLARLLSGEDI